ncbi:MAG: hypothetical protein WBN64_14370 [Candidatus Deferrimicrobium sp.]
MTLPDIIAHADWGTSPGKRWMVKATLTGGVYQLGNLECVADLQKFVASICRECANGKRIMLGFDFPIGLPAAYAKKAGIESFRTELSTIGSGRWKNFFEVAQAPNQISIERPFYPARSGKTKQQHLVDALGLDCIDQLRRRCDLPQPGRNAACPLFWTLGANQVGKGAIVGWRDEFYGHLGITLGKEGKRKQKVRQDAAPAMIQWADKAGVDITQSRSMIEDGFGTDPVLSKDRKLLEIYEEANFILQNVFV